MNIKKVLSFIFVILVAGYTLFIFKDPYNHMFIHAVNLVIHEAGHTLFIFFGQFMNILGGSLLQVLVPFVFAVYFLFWQRNPVSASIMLFWTAINLIEVSIYAGDAISMNLPLLGHDEGDIKLNDNVSIRLWHGEDRNSYALSYRVQKILESLQGGDKPSIMFCGHTHKYVKLFERNVHAISIGCLEDQTKWMRGKRLAANPGFGIYDITFNNTGVTKLNETFYPFY